MLRSAAKNYAGVAVVVDPADYATRARRAAAQRRRLGERRASRSRKKAFAHTAAYDGAIANYLTRSTRAQRREFPGRAQPAVRTSCRTCATARTRTRRAAFYRDAQPVAGRPRALPAAAGQGALLQQHRRRRRGVGMREELRRAGVRHRQARQPLRRRASATTLRDAYAQARSRPTRSPPSAASSPSTARSTRATAEARRQAVRRGGHRAARRGRGAEGARQQGEPARARSAARARARKRMTSSASAAGCWCRAPTRSVSKRIGPQGRHAARSRAPQQMQRPAVRLARGQVREVQRHRVLPRRRARSASAPAR